MARIIIEVDDKLIAEDFMAWFSGSGEQDYWMAFEDPEYEGQKYIREFCDVNGEYYFPANIEGDVLVFTKSELVGKG